MESVSVEGDAQDASQQSLSHVTQHLNPVSKITVGTQSADILAANALVAILRSTLVLMSIYCAASPTVARTRLATQRSHKTHISYSVLFRHPHIHEP